jgi:hypothetical protein
MNCFYVYVLFRPDGRPCYVGKGKGKRWLRNERPNNPHLRNIVRKAKQEGKELPRIKMRDGLTEAEAFELERIFIKAMGREPNGPLVNLTDGGEGAANPSPETRAKMRARQTALMSDPAVRASIGEKNKIRMKDPKYKAAWIDAIKDGMSAPEARAYLKAKAAERRERGGYKPSQEVRIVISTKAKERMRDPKRRAAISQKLIGSKHSDETKAKMTASQLERLDKRRKAGLPVNFPARDEQARRAAISATMLAFRAKQRAERQQEGA